MLQPQYHNNALSSFLLWVDHKVCSNGAFTNYSGNFYPIQNEFSNYYAYGAVNNQMVADSSISGATIMTGLYINNVLITTGQSGFLDVDYKHGMTYFSNNVNTATISGYFSIKDFNIVLTDKQDDILLFKTKYNLRQKFPQKPTGVLSDNITYPIIFVKFDGSRLNPFALGGSEQESLNIRCIILADSLYNLHAVQSILQDSIRTPIALLSSNDMPFNARGGIKSGVYNYTGLANNYINQQNFMFLENITVPKFSQRLLMANKDLNYDVFYNSLDFELTKVRDLSRKSI